MGQNAITESATRRRLDVSQSNRNLPVKYGRRTATAEEGEIFHRQDNAERGYLFPPAVWGDDNLMQG